LLSSYKNLRSCLIEHWVTGTVIWSHSNWKREHNYIIAYPVPPKKHVETLKRLCDLGVLKWQADSKWALLTFIIPKKDNTLRVVSNFREINKRIVRKPFPIRKISSVLKEREGFTYATSLDLNKGCYNIRLDPDASKLCIIILPWGKYSYLSYQWALHVLPTSSKLRCLI
jgi:hypothetical protein